MDDFTNGHRGNLGDCYLCTVKKGRLYILVFVLLSSALLFNQVGLNFFHDSHEAHAYYTAAKKGQTMLLKHGEHCQVCSLEVLFNVVLPVSTEVPTQFLANEFNSKNCPEIGFIFSERARGRAPPSQA
jgi:hypothetical protein